MTDLNLSLPRILGTAIVVSFIAVGFSNAQSPAPTPTPPEDQDVVKISTNLIQIDVSITDSKGRPIRDLRADEVEIFENGKRQQVTGFSFVSAGTVREMAEEAPRRPADPLGVPPPPATLRPENVRRTIALVVDDLTLSFESAYATRRALRKYVETMVSEGDLVAIIRTGGGMGALQQFTADRRVLDAAIARVRWNPLGNSNLGAFAPVEPSMLELSKSLGNTEVSEEDLEAERNFNNSNADARASAFATGTIGALRFIIQGMGELPGRKSVVLFSEGFSLTERDTNGFIDPSRVNEHLNDLVEVANRNSVVFYTIDSRGLVYTGPTAADKIIDPSPQAISRIYSERSSIIFNTQGGLNHLAKATGGFDIINNNDLAGGIRRVLDDQSYYLVAYEPGDETFDPKKIRYNRIEIKVNRPGAQVRHRSRFLNVAEESTRRRTTGELSPRQHIEAALLSPFGVNEIALSLNPLYGNDAQAGDFVRSLLHINASDLKFVDEADGMKRAEFTVVAASFGDNGIPVAQVGREYTIRANKEVYDRINRDGFVYHFTFPIQKPGAFQYRVALRDKLAGTVGSASQFIEVPNLKKNRHAVSGIVLQSYTRNEWSLLTTAAAAADPAPVSSDPLIDTSLRRFRPGSVMQYSYEVYGARTGAGGRPSLTAKIRLFHEGKIVLDGKELPVDTAAQADPKRLRAAGAIDLLPEMASGDYVLQVIVFDNAAGRNRPFAVQFVQFEVVP